MFWEQGQPPLTQPQCPEFSPGSWTMTPFLCLVRLAPFHSSFPTAITGSYTLVPGSGSTTMATTHCGVFDEPLSPVTRIKPQGCCSPLCPHRAHCLARQRRSVNIYDKWTLRDCRHWRRCGPWWLGVCLHRWYWGAHYFWMQRKSKCIDPDSTGTLK